MNGWGICKVSGEPTAADPGETEGIMRLRIVSLAVAIAIAATMLATPGSSAAQGRSTPARILFSPFLQGLCSTESPCSYGASVVNDSRSVITATIEFCDQFGVCDTAGTQCNSETVQPRRACIAALSAIEFPYGYYVRIFVWGAGNAEVRGALQVVTPTEMAVVEAH